jgi:hypothetical protein
MGEIDVGTLVLNAVGYQSFKDVAIGEEDVALDVDLFGEPFYPGLARVTDFSWFFGSTEERENPIKKFNKGAEKSGKAASSLF